MRTQFLTSHDAAASDHESALFTSVRPVRRQLPWAVRQKNLAARFAPRHSPRGSTETGSAARAGETCVSEAQLQADRAYIFGDCIFDIDPHAELGPETQYDDDDAGWF